MGQTGVTSLAKTYRFLPGVQFSTRRSRDSLLEELTDQPVVEFVALLDGSLDATFIWLTKYSVG